MKGQVDDLGERRGDNPFALFGHARPAAFVIGCPRIIQTHRLELPHSILEARAALVNAREPEAVAARSARELEQARAYLRGLPVARDMNDRLDQLVHRKIVCWLFAGIAALDGLPDALASIVIAYGREFSPAVARKEIGGFVPHEFVQIISVRAGKIFGRIERHGSFCQSLCFGNSVASVLRLSGQQELLVIAGLGLLRLPALSVPFGYWVARPVTGLAK